jgi:hypothetical protein
VKNYALLIIISLFLVSCAVAPAAKESPMVYFSNASVAPISDIQCHWVNATNLSLPTLNPGDSRTQSFYVKDYAEFFGLIKFSWVNAQGESVQKEFFLREKHLPSIVDPTTYNYVQFYFDQYDVEVTTSDAPDLSGKTRKMDAMLKQYHNAYLRKDPTPQNSLITVRPQRDDSVPITISTEY